MSGSRWRAISSVRWLSIAVTRCTRGRQAGQRRQMADAAQAVEQERDRAAVVFGRRLAPAGERAEEGARVAIAQAHLAVGAAVGDRAQRLGHRLRRRPRQADELAPGRRHALDDAGAMSALVEHRRAGEQAVQQRRRRRARRARRRRAARAARSARAARRGRRWRARRGRRLVAGVRARRASAITLAWPRSLTSTLCSCRSRWATPASCAKARPRSTAGDPARGVVDGRRRMLRPAIRRA